MGRHFIEIAGAIVLLAACGSKPVSTTTAQRAVEPAEGVLLDETGQLAEGDLRVGRGFADHYEVAVREGDRISVQLDSTAFDPFLEVIPPDGEPLNNDDWGGSRQQSRIDLVAAAGGVLKVRVTSYAQGATGAYRVRVERSAAPTGPGAPGGTTPSSPQAVAMLGAGQSMQGELTEGDAILTDGSFYDQLVIDVQQGQPMVVRVSSVEGTPPRVEVMDPDGHALRAAEPGVFPLVAAGLHRVLVAGSQPGQRGRYSAEARLAAGAQDPVTLQRDHHRPPQGITATDVRLGQQVTATLAAGDVRLPSGETADVYRLQGSAGTRLSLEMSSSDIDSYLLVIGPGGRHWENDDSGGTVNAALGFELPANGAYDIVATSYRAGETGPYELKVFDDARVVAPPGQTPAAQPVSTTTGTAASRRAGSLAAGDTQLGSGELADRYNFVWQAGQRVRVSVASTEFDTYVIVVSPSGRQTDNDDVAAGDTNSSIDHEVTETGPHRVIVTSYQPGETGSYELRIDSVGGAQAATQPQPPPTQAPPGWRTVSGSLAAGNRTLRTGEFFDAHEMQWPAGQAVHLEARSSEFDTYLMVQPPAGDQQDNDDQAPGNTNAAIDLVTRTAGVYRVLVTSYRPGEQGSYELLVGTPGGNAAQPTQPTQPAQPTRPAQPVAAGREIRGALAQGDETLRSGEFSDSHVVTLEAGSSIRIRLSSTEFDPYLIVRTPSGRQIDNDDFEPGSLGSGVDLPRTEAGEHSILVTSYRPAETGSYVLRFEDGPSVVGPAVGAGSGGAGAGGRVFGVFAGITDYPSGVNDLPECANDAIKLAETLRQANLLTEDRQVLLTDARATRANIRQAMSQMAQRVGPDDLFVFFYSGHGGRREGGSSDVREIDGADEYIFVYDGELLDDEMGQLFDGIHSRVAVLALDACFAGGFAKDVITAPGRIGLFSSEEDVTSAVAGAFQAGGYLSHFLRTGIAGEADADPHDGVLTVGELTHYLNLQFGRHVRDVRMSEGYQHLVVDRGAVRTSQVLWAYR